MNRHATELILHFNSRGNRMVLWNNLRRIFPNPKVHGYLVENFDGLVRRFTVTMRIQMANVDPMPGISEAEELYAFNVQFLHDRCQFIQTHILGMDQHADRYVVGDGAPTGRYAPAYYTRGASDLLAAWNMNSATAPGATLRGDPQSTTSGACRPYSDAVVSGITICDQSDLNTSQHISQFEDNSYHVALNRERDWTNSAFGDRTPASDARLLSRRTFRSNEAGVENGIPRYEARLYVRSLDRDITETLHNQERDCMVHGYDMSSIHRRMAQRDAVKAKYSATCNQRNKSALANNSTFVWQ